MEPNNHLFKFSKIGMEDASHPENWNGYWKSFRTFISMAAKQAAGDLISLVFFKFSRGIHSLIRGVAPPDLKISPIMHFVIHNSVVLSKILKIVVPSEQNFENLIFYSIKLVILIIIDIDKQES